MTHYLAAAKRGDPSTATGPRSRSAASTSTACEGDAIVEISIFEADQCEADELVRDLRSSDP
jgi:hypothetical protein